MSDTARPTLFSRLVMWVLVCLFHLSGWKVVGGPPEFPRCLIIGAPHTSNWDFIRFVGVMDELELRPAFIGKHTLFRGPMGKFMRELGGIPVDRDAPGGIAQQVAGEFASREEFLLVMSPEGTRGSVSRWKTGFYRIAVAAGVPIVCGFLDHKRKELGLGPAIMPSGDFAADAHKFAEFYSQYYPITAEQIIGNDAGA